MREPARPYLVAHVVVAGPVEVLIGPVGECALRELVGCAVIVERELGVRLQELRLLHAFL